MENKNLIDLSVKYGLTEIDLSKLASTLTHAGITDPSSVEFKRAAAYICDMNILNMPAEELAEELKRKGLAIE